MRLPALRSFIHGTVLAGLPLAGLPLVAGCGGTTGGCTDPARHEVVLAEKLDPDLQALYDRCFGDDTDCLALCEALVLRIEGGGPPPSFSECGLEPGDGRIVAMTYELCYGGRRPAGLADPVAPRASSASGAFFARLAHLEAASVHAFVGLARELAAHGAPGRLVRAALRSAFDEIRHARVTAVLAAAGGAHPEPARVEPTPAGSLEDLALENAAEGCVRETFGALVAAWQARAAADPGVRRAMDRIARDETRHAALAWELDRWARRRLGPAVGRRLDAARAAAVAELERATEGTPELATQAGLPDGPAYRFLVDRARQTLWASA